MSCRYVRSVAGNSHSTTRPKSARTVRYWHVLEAGKASAAHRKRLLPMSWTVMDSSPNRVRATAATSPALFRQATTRFASVRPHHVSAPRIDLPINNSMNFTDHMSQ
eukprot:2131802-Pyramimonas_sp.AAC.1